MSIITESKLLPNGPRYFLLLKNQGAPNPEALEYAHSLLSDTLFRSYEETGVIPTAGATESSFRDNSPAYLHRNILGHS